MLLSLDLMGAFDRVHPTRLLDILRKKGMPGWLVRWVQAFSSSRTTILIIQGKETEPFPINFGVPQGLPLSPVLFAFYVSELLDICNQPKNRLSALGFANNTHILTYGTSTAANCRLLEWVHEQCLAWAARHGMSFAPNKYELTHFTRSRTKFDLKASARFGTGLLVPTASSLSTELLPHSRSDPEFESTSLGNAVKEILSMYLAT
jgi:hypothetical protein